MASPAPAPPRVSRNVSLPAGSQPPTVGMLARRTLSESDLEPGAATAPSGSSSSSSLSSRSNESNTVPAEPQASQSDWSDEDEPLAAQWADSLPPRALDSLTLSARLRKRQEVIHELIISEGSHVRWLRVLGCVFLRPLEASGLLPPDDLRALLPNLPQVRERHAKLYADLKALRSDPEQFVVHIRPVAEALLNTLGDAGYAPSLARFCRGQRMALDALKERRRKNKELHQFLASREQLPLCGRLQLRDLLACVWQRLTKYQLLLESILKTASEEDSEDNEKDSPEDIETVRKALNIAKEVLHSVDTAIRTSENEHRLRTIQAKLEVRISIAGSEWDEARRLDLTSKVLRMEGELSIRNDSNKKMSVLALMLEDALVLLQREGERFVLRPITPPSQQTLLSPLIKWEKVLFRPNAAMRHTFFLMNINGVQMHELSASSANEYALWVRHMGTLPLAKPELRPSLVPHHAASRPQDDSGINVSRNPSDASEKSTSSAAPEEEGERERGADKRPAKAEREEERAERAERDERNERNERNERDEAGDAHVPRRPTVGRITTHGADADADGAPLLDARALRVAPAAAAQAHDAALALAPRERLRRLDDGLARALRAKAALVAELLGLAPDSFAHVADLAVADTLGQVDVCGELRASRLSRGSSAEDDAPPDTSAPDMHQLLLAAQAQANQLTETLSRALNVSEAACVAGRAMRQGGRCGSCRRRADPPVGVNHNSDVPESGDPSPAEATDDRPESGPAGASLDKDLSYDMLPELEAAAALDADDALEWPGAAALAGRLAGACGGLQVALGRLLAALPQLEHERRALRTELAALRDANDRLRHRDGRKDPADPADPASIQEQPSNGG